MRKYQYEGLIDHFKKESDEWVPATVITSILYLFLVSFIARAFILIVQFITFLTNPWTRYFTDTQFILAVLWTIIFAAIPLLAYNEIEKYGFKETDFH